MLTFSWMGKRGLGCYLWPGTVVSWRPWIFSLYILQLVGSFSCIPYDDMVESLPSHKRSKREMLHRTVGLLRSQKTELVPQWPGKAPRSMKTSYRWCWPPRVIDQENLGMFGKSMGSDAKAFFQDASTWRVFRDTRALKTSFLPGVTGILGGVTHIPKSTYPNPAISSKSIQSLIPSTCLHSGYLDETWNLHFEIHLKKMHRSWTVCETHGLMWYCWFNNRVNQLLYTVVKVDGATPKRWIRKGPW